MLSDPIDVAMISRSLPPYRVYVHRRIVEGIPQINLHSLVTHALHRWDCPPPDEIRPMEFGDEGPDRNKITPGTLLRDWQRAGRIIDWIGKSNIRAVIVEGYFDLARLRILHWCHRTGLPCFLTGDSNIRGDTAGFPKSWLKRIVVSRVVSWVQGVMPCGTLGEAYFLKYGADPKRVFYYSREPDCEMIQQLPLDVIARTQKEFGLHDDRRRIVYCGRLVPIKRVDLAIDAFAAIARDRPQWDLVVIGDGQCEDELKKRVPSDLHDRIIWTGFIADPQQIAAIYRASDILVLPSDFEPWALVILEAAAAEMAIISSYAVAAAAEVVREGVNGGIFDVGDLDGLIQRMQTVTQDDRIDDMKAASAQLLNDWRTRADPVEALREALKTVGVLGPEDPDPHPVAS